MFVFITFTVTIVSPAKAAPILSPEDIAPQPEYKSNMVLFDRWESFEHFATSGKKKIKKFESCRLMMNLNFLDNCVKTYYHKVKITVHIHQLSMVE